MKFKDLLNEKKNNNVLNSKDDWMEIIRSRHKKVKFERSNKRDMIARVGSKQVGYWDDDDKEGIIN